MDKLYVSTSQSRAREELVQEDIWDETEEDIWAEIFHRQNGKTVLRNISSGDSVNSENTLQDIELEETCLEVLAIMIL